MDQFLLELPPNFNSVSAIERSSAEACDAASDGFGAWASPVRNSAFPLGAATVTTVVFRVR
ncbi:MULTISPECIES: hypothetical protein [Ralstonia solanacearum species complex]|uniref:hypothetical protein n=1 Tax=Ralstonia solanacearum species complex TaxID=3116862 RepID=UPI00078B8FC1|nr:hypothetical protein [Ralstonia solanacearum]AMP40297.1 hypothetical protein LBM2029_22410 [Ralstonia solanacearum]BEU74914.1 hypothetical protein MAFF211271_44690 [Ralstonia pseudosolanacearum]